jgi:hypothetical protein
LLGVVERRCIYKYIYVDVHSQNMGGGFKNLDGWMNE